MSDYQSRAERAEREVERLAGILGRYGRGILGCAAAGCEGCMVCNPESVVSALLSRVAELEAELGEIEGLAGAKPTPLVGTVVANSVVVVEGSIDTFDMGD